MICDPRHYERKRRDTVTNPTVIIEVLSPSTEAKDRGEKFQHYQTIASLTKYLLIAQDTTRVEQFSRHDNHLWMYNQYISPAQEIQFGVIQCSLNLEEIYEDVEFAE